MFPGAVMINSLYWMVFGIAQILIIAGGYAWLKSANKSVKPWQMAILYGTFASFLLVIGGGFTLAGEYESQAGWYFIGFLGVPHILAFALFLRLFVFKKQTV